MNMSGPQFHEADSGLLSAESASRLELTVLVDNQGDGDRLAAEHGLAILLEIDGYRVLFDTGQGPALLQNAHRLDVRLEGLDALVLSHGHYDHTGGVAEILRRNPRLRVYAHPKLMYPCYSRREPLAPKPIGIPAAAHEALLKHLPQITWTVGPTQITQGVWVTGAIKRIKADEDPGGFFFLDPAGQLPDLIEADQALWVRTPKGIVVVLGCAHAGVVNTLDQISRLTGAQEIHAVIGGLHLANADELRLLRTLKTFEGYRLQLLGPCHCTGSQAQAMIAGKFKDEYCAIHAGRSIYFS